MALFGVVGDGSVKIVSYPFLASLSSDKAGAFYSIEDTYEYIHTKYVNNISEKIFQQRNSNAVPAWISYLDDDAFRPDLSTDNDSRISYDFAR